jgi:predicted dehydrogenase
MTDSESNTTRRRFLQNSTATAAAVTLGLNAIGAPKARAARGANEKIRVGCIGVGNRGTQLLRSFLKQDDVQIAALCDVYEPYLMRDNSKVSKTLQDSLGGRIPTMTEDLGSDVARYKDFRRLLDRKDLDAVVIATPDHWHAIQAISACQAGKDVYVEKPLSVTVVEGRKMVEAAERYNRVVQVGLHRRSSKGYMQTVAAIQSGAIGKITVGRAYRISDMSPNGIGRYPDTKPPEGLDWNMWLGPRAERPYKDDMAFYKFRWWKSYSSQMGNWGVHYLDAMRWILGQEAPISISAHGGRFAIDDDRTIPDTMEVIFELPSGVLLVFGQYEASGGEALAEGEIELRGTLGNLYCGSEAKSFNIVPSRGGQFQDPKPRIEPSETKRIDGDLTDQHVRNFVDCVKSRAKTHCDMETGHRSTTFALLANIALATKSRIEWDPKTEQIINNKKASRLLHYKYRKPWKLT